MVRFLTVGLVLAIATYASAETCAEEFASSKKLLEGPTPPFGLELPNCDKQGRYAPKQCRGSQCFCVLKDGTETGHSLFRWEAPEDMHCNCARMTARLAKYGIRGVAECASDGSYKQVQCRRSYCFCVDTKTGMTTRKSGMARSEHKERLKC